MKILIKAFIIKLLHIAASSKLGQVGVFVLFWITSI